MPHDVFICYASQDKSVAEAVCDALEVRQIKCWIAPRDVLPGVQWAESIVDAIDSSRAIVLVLSANSNISPQVIREVGRAAGKSIPIIPFRIDDVIPSKSMDYFVSGHQWLDAQTDPLEKHLKRLTDTVQNLLTPEKAEEKAETKEKTPVAAEKPAKPKAKKPWLKQWWLWAGAAVAAAVISIFVFLPGETAQQHYTAGVALLEEGNYEQAILEFDKAIEMDTAYAAAYHDRGLASYYTGDYDLAIADLSSALELDVTIEVDPAYAVAYYDRGLGCYYEGDYDQAIADFTMAIELDPYYTDAYHFRGDAYLGQGDYDLAIAGFTNAIELNSNHCYAYYDRGICYYYQGEYDAAIADITEAIAIDSSDADFYYFRGVVYREQGEDELAIADFKKCLELAGDQEDIQRAQDALEQLGAWPLSPELMHEDDFSNPASGWPQESFAEYEYDYEDGEYHILAKQLGGSTYVLNQDTGPFTDFTLEIDARLVSGPVENGYGVIFRAQQSDDFYCFMVSGNGFYNVWKWLDDNYTYLQEWTESGFINEGNSTNHLKVVCQGSQIEVYANGHYLTTVIDDSFTGGCLGVVAGASEFEAHAAFDNIKVYSPD
jgi:tetratricopeptide (TPR) repeat protein